MPHAMTLGLINHWLWRWIGGLAFNRIAVIDQENLPGSGPVLFVATHRNGALDAAPYKVAVPRAIPMVSAQLHRMPLGRCLFRGIAVARAKDRGRGIEADNQQALQACVELLRAGGQLLVMPEGTSTLGPRHLPFHRGAARIARAVMDAGTLPTIVPLAVHYEDPTAWQSRVEVRVGRPLYPQADAKVAELHRQISLGLEQVGVNFPDEGAQFMAERLAYAATLGTGLSYARSLKSFEGGTPGALIEQMQQLQVLAQQQKLVLHQGVPLVPVGSWIPYAAYWMLLAPLVASFVLFNWPALALAVLASRKLADALNVIAFWRMAIGLPTGLAWGLSASLMVGYSVGPWGVVVYWLASAGGVLAWYRFRKLSVALANALLRSNAKPALLQAYRCLFDRMTHDQSS